MAWWTMAAAQRGRGDVLLLAGPRRPSGGPGRGASWRFRPLTPRTLVSPEGIQFLLGCFCIVFEVVAAQANQFILVTGVLLCAGAASRVTSWR